MNTQAPEKLSRSPLLQVHSVFNTIQGEGPFTGHPAIFIRLAGCNLQCPGCDTEYTANRETWTDMELASYVRSRARAETLVVITGGEPFRQRIGGLCRILLGMGYRVQVETNGTLPPSPLLPEEVVVVCSPKSGSINRELLERADCFKYVMHHSSVNVQDGLPILALDHTAKPQVARPPRGDKRPVYLQPMDTKDDADNEMSLKFVRNSCLTYGYILQLQLHKIIEVE